MPRAADPPVGERIRAERTKRGVSLLRNGSVSGVNLNVDGGWLLT